MSTEFFQAPELRRRNKNLAGALGALIKASQGYLDSEIGSASLETEIEIAQDELTGNAVELISFPDYLKKKIGNTDKLWSDRLISVQEVIEIFKKWDQ